MLPSATWVIAEAYAGLQAQGLGLTEAAGLAATVRPIAARGLWRHVPAAFWPAPLAAIGAGTLAPPLPELLVGVGGKAAAVIAALRTRVRGVAIQHPRIDPRKFDFIVVGRHDELTGPNVFVARTALHRASPARLAEAAAAWAPRLAHLPRPLVSVLIGGSNGRFRLGLPEARALAGALAEMMRRDPVGLALTPSRRTEPAATQAFAEALQPLGAFIWDGTKENPYFGMLALADAIVVTVDSVSMVSEAAATRAPVLLAALPGGSRRIGLFLRDLIDAGRVRPYQGRFETWPVAPLDDTEAAAAAMCRRFGY
jgi:mitochondrial fission protein ELM1